MAESAASESGHKQVLALTSHDCRVYIALVKWRNQLLALFCLALFAAFGVFYFRNWVVQKPFGIILFIGEGLTPERLTAARIYNGGADTPLALDSLGYTALLKNYSADFATPDQAAAATALATGVKVNNGAIARDASGKVLMNLLELAHESGRTTGLVTNGSLTSPTAAAFYAHSADANDPESLAHELVENAHLDVVLGGGSADFLPPLKGGRRGDDRDLLLDARRAGYDLVRTRAELDAMPRWRRPKLLGVFANQEMAFSDAMQGRAEQPNLTDMVRRAIELLQFNTGGYLLVVDVGLMRTAAQRNQGERTLMETLELDRAVGVATRYAGTKSTILVCGDVGIGGLSLNGFPFRQDSGVAMLGVNSTGDPWLTWSTGPNGVASYGATRIEAATAHPDPHEQRPASSPGDNVEPAAVFSETALNTAGDVLVFGQGLNATELHGTLQSTAVFDLIRDNL
ncbi:MAG: alkaline phosphatase [Chthoniobacterales bacterium]